MDRETVMAGDPRPKQGLVRRSVRRTRFDREYAAIRPQILARNAWCCEFPLCEARATVVHHKKGRGADGNRPEHLMALCDPCHRFIHENPTRSYENGWLVRRLG